MVGLSVGCRFLSVLQVVAIVVCYRGTVSSERVQGCVESRLTLRCPEMQVIEVTSIVLGDTHCRGTSCCIEDSDCTRNPNANHRAYVYRSCNGEQICTVGVLREKITCGIWGGWSNNDFERITYSCAIDPRRTTTSVRPTSRPETTETSCGSTIFSTENDETNDVSTNSNDEVSTVFDLTTDSGSTYSLDERENSMKMSMEQTNSNVLTPVVMATVCLIVLSAIVVIVAALRRKRWSKPSNRPAMEMRATDSSDRNEAAIDPNETQPVSLNNGTDGCPVYTNIEFKKSSNNEAKASDTYLVPREVACGLACDAGSRPVEDPYVCCDKDSREPAYQVPRPISNVYSYLRGFGESECAGSAASASGRDSNVYCNVGTRVPASALDASEESPYDEIINLKESESKAIAGDGAKKTDSQAHTRASDLYTKVNKPGKHTTSLDSDIPLNGKVGAKDELKTSDGLPNPIDETMPPTRRIQEAIYANGPAPPPPSNGGSSASRTPLTGTSSEMENPYCEMRSPSLKKFKDGGSQILVDNDLYK